MFHAFDMEKPVDKQIFGRVGFGSRLADDDLAGGFRKRKGEHIGGFRAAKLVWGQLLVFHRLAHLRGRYNRKSEVICLSLYFFVELLTQSSQALVASCGEDRGPGALQFYRA